MKKIFAVIALLFVGSMCLWAKNDIASLGKLAENYRGKEGFEVVHVSGIPFGLLRTLAAFADADDQTEQALKSLKGIKSMLVVDYEDASLKLKQEFNTKAEKILSGMEMLMDAEDDGERVRMYGIVSEDGKTLSDYVIFCPDDGTLVCFSGKINMEEMMELAQ